MKKLASVLGAISFLFLFISGAESALPFWQHAFFLFLFLIIGGFGLFLSLWLIKKAEEKEKGLIVEGRKSSLLRQCRRIAATKKK